MRSCFCRICIAIIGLCALTSFAADRSDKALVFKVPVLPELQQHLYLLENPAYMVLALENNGMSPSLSSKTVIKDRTGFEIRNLAVRFSGKSGSVYRYDAMLKFSLAGIATELKVPAEVDISALKSGTLTISAFPPMAGAVPPFLLEKVDFKLKLIADLSKQREIVRYLDGLPQTPPAAGALDARLETIITEAYNRASNTVVSGKDVGEATPVSEQIALILTLVIWLIGLPVVMFVRYRRNMRRLRAQPSDAGRA
jgi:hypothetical protein